MENEQQHRKNLNAVKRWKKAGENFRNNNKNLNEKYIVDPNYVEENFEHEKQILENEEEILENKKEKQENFEHTAKVIDEKTDEVVEDMNISSSSKNRAKNFFSKISEAVKKKVGMVSELVEFSKGTIQAVKEIEDPKNREKKEEKKLKKEIEAKEKAEEERLKKERKAEEERIKKENKDRENTFKQAEKERKAEEERLKKERKAEEERLKKERKAEEEKKKKKEREDFVGREHFSEDFEGKDKRNFFKRKWEQYKLDKERKTVNYLYKSRVEKLNNQYFKDILGEENMVILNKIKNKEERKLVEIDMLKNLFEKAEHIKEEIADYDGIASENELLNKYGISKKLYKDIQRPYFREEVFNKIKIRDDAEEEVEKRKQRMKKSIIEESSRRRFSLYVEKDLQYYRNKIKELEERKLPGDKEEIKKIKAKIKSLDKIDRVKVDFKKDLEEENTKENSENKNEKSTNYEEYHKKESIWQRERRERAESFTKKQWFESAKDDFINQMEEKRKENTNSYFDVLFASFIEFLKEFEIKK